MKKILTFIVLLTASVFAMTCNAEVKYKGYLNVGGSVTSGDTYQYVMGCDGKIGLTLSTEHCTEDNVLNLEFDDVNEDIVIWKGHTFYGITDEQAEQIVDFIEKHKGKDFYIHCRAGKSRSIAVATYILDMYGEEYGYNEKESCRKDNPCKIPNINVLTKLKRTYYKKFNIYES